MLSKIVRVKIQSVLRKTHLLGAAEAVRYQFKLFSSKSRNRKFIRENPEFAVPPSYLAFDAYSAPDWIFYKMSGEGTATFLVNDVMKKHVGGRKNLAVYEWGCGPGRVIRHLPEKLDTGAKVYGSDYNPETIAWCSKSITAVAFSLNNLTPPLIYEDKKFDFIYCISVFTHLSEATGLQWIQELHRVLKPDGVLLFTTSGDSAYNTELLDSEKKEYESKGVVVKGQYEEGKKMYLARHNPSYVRRELLKDFDVLEHSPAGFPFIAQDYWVVRPK